MATAYEYLRNEFFNAKNKIFRTTSRSRIRRHDFGGTLGGPDVIPKL